MITTQVFDTSLGRPAERVAVTLEIREGARWQHVATVETDEDGRARTPLPQGHQPAPGHYRLSFAIAAYFAGRGLRTFYPEVVIVFDVTGAERPCHVPLLLSPFGYSTWLGR